LRSATSQATLAQAYAKPSAAQIAAPPDSSPTNDAQSSPFVPGEASPMAANPMAANPMLWETLVRGPSMPLSIAASADASPDNATVTAMSARSAPIPAPQVLSPSALKERGQAFLRSIKGFDQTSTAEYENPAQARAWGSSTCSAASLTAVLRAAGKDVRIADVMKAMPGGMTIQLGLVSRPSLVNAANQFGAKATDDVNSYEGLDQATENGQPVLVDIRNSRFPEGHWIVVTGADENGVQVADSSRYDLKSIPRGEFMRSWSGRGIRLEGLTPTSSSTSANAQSA